MIRPCSYSGGSPAKLKWWAHCWAVMTDTGLYYYLAIASEFQGRCQCHGSEAGEKAAGAEDVPQFTAIDSRTDNTATLSMFDKRWPTTECQQDSLTYSKRLITGPEY